MSSGPNKSFNSNYVCTHKYCYRAPPEGGGQEDAHKRRDLKKHIESVHAHKDLCKPDCMTCYTLWERSAHDEFIALQFKPELSEYKLPPPRTPTAQARSGASTPRSPARSLRRNSLPLAATDDSSARSMSFSTFGSSSAGSRRLSNSSGFENRNLNFQNASGGRAAQAERNSAAVDAKLREALANTIAEMPPNSALRPQLIASIAEKSGLQNTQVAQALGVSTTTVSAAKQSEDRSAVKMNRARKAAAPVQKSDDAIAFAKQFWIDMSRQTQKRDDNGERLDFYFYDVSQDEIYDAYKLRVVEAYMEKHKDIVTDSFSAGENGDDAHLLFEKICKQGEALKRSTFISVKPKNVDKGQIEECACGQCIEGYANQDALELLRDNLHRACGVGVDHDAATCPRANEDKRVKELSAADLDFRVHKERAREQRQHFQALRDGGMSKGEAMALFDFSPYNSAYRQRRTMDEGMTGVQCLHIVLFVGNGEGGSEKQYFDYFSEDSNDYYFFRAAMLDFFQRDELKNVTVAHYVSDGGPKHFKIRRSIGFALVELPILLGWTHRPTWHFFEASHGKSDCDSRAAVVKFFLKRLALRGTDSRGAAGIASNIVNAREQKLTHRNATALGLFEKSKTYDWKEFDSIRHWHLLQWTGKEVKVGKFGDNTGGRAFMLRCLETSTSKDNVVEQLAIPKYKIEPLAKSEVRRIATITKKEKNKRKRDALREAATEKAKAVVGIVDAKETIINTDLKRYTVGTIICVLFDDKWYAGKILKTKKKYIGRRQLHTSDKKVEIYITMVSVRFIDPLEQEGATIGDQDIELQKNNLDFVDDVRLVKCKKFRTTLK